MVFVTGPYWDPRASPGVQGPGGPGGPPEGLIVHASRIPTSKAWTASHSRRHGREWTRFELLRNLFFPLRRGLRLLSRRYSWLYYSGYSDANELMVGLLLCMRGGGVYNA